VESIERTVKQLTAPCYLPALSGLNDASRMAFGPHPAEPESPVHDPDKNVLSLTQF